MSKSTAKDHARTIWCTRLQSALRSAFACAIVGGATLYGPNILLNQLQFPGLSYVVTILILFNAATLGHALSGCWHAFYATIQVVPLAMLSRWLVSPGGKGELSVGVAALAAAAASFLVALPESTHVTAKRIALGQIALICTEVVVNSDDTIHGFMNPLHIGASAILGALASLLALLLPFPGLAHHKINKLCKVYAENACKRMDIYLKALNAEDHHTKMELVLQAKPIAEIGTKLLQSIQILQEGLFWERPWGTCTRNKYIIEIENRLQSFEIPMKSIEYTLTHSSRGAFPLQISDQQQQQFSALLSTQLHTKIQKIRDGEDHELMENLPIGPVRNNGPACLIFSCMAMLLDAKKQNCRDPGGIIRFLKPGPALKFSISIGLAVLLGVVLERDNARWAGLTVAITFASVRHQPIFTTANARAQGTAVGSVYGVICCFLSRRPEMRLLALLPWIVLAAFLKHSKLYGLTGGVSAAIGASVILGRRNYGPPNEFAIGRMTSVFIGLFCFVLVGLVFQPMRAATLAQTHLSETLLSLGEFLKQTRFYHSERENELFPKFHELRERQRALKAVVADAKSEPGFWYLPFHSCCYKKVVGCLGNVVSLLYVAMHNLEVLSSSGLQLERGKEFEEQLNYELGELQRTVASSLEKVSSDHQIKAWQVDPRDDFGDVEGGKSRDDLEMLGGMIVEEVVRNGGDDEKQVRAKVRCLGAIGFCMASLRNEIDQVEGCVNEIVRWGNHQNQ